LCHWDVIQCSLRDSAPSNPGDFIAVCSLLCLCLPSILGIHRRQADEINTTRASTRPTHKLLQPRPMTLESPNTRSEPITIADGPNTGGVRYSLVLKSFGFSAISSIQGAANPYTVRFPQALNRHPSQATAFQVGVAEDKGTRRTMEDTHSFVVDFDNIPWTRVCRLV